MGAPNGFCCWQSVIFMEDIHLKWVEEESVVTICTYCPISVTWAYLIFLVRPRWTELTFALCYLYRKSAELVEALLKLSDLGHYQQVSELFKFPVQHCPDLLVINLLQTSVRKISIAYIFMISELIGNCIMMKHRWYVGELIGMFIYQQYMKWWDPWVTGLLPLQHLLKVQADL